MADQPTASAAAPPRGHVFVIRAPALPQFRFEWHPGVKRVYVVRQGAEPEIGDPIAYEIADAGAATNAVLIWTRDFRAAQAEAALAPAVQRAS